MGVMGAKFTCNHTTKDNYKYEKGNGRMLI